MDIYIHMYKHMLYTNRYTYCSQKHSLSAPKLSHKLKIVSLNGERFR